jgi:K+-transporting ATPase KdpF subunit
MLGAILQAVEAIYFVAAAIAIGLLIYLFIALIKPEWFR